MVYDLSKNRWIGIILFSVILAILLALKVRENYVFASSSVVFNEIFYDPSGTDSGYEWIELYNPLSVELPIGGWKVQVAGSIFTDVATLPIISIPTKGYLTICESKVVECDVYVSKLTIQNGGESSDGIQLLDSKGNVVDTVIYDSPNTNNLTKENGTVVGNNETASASGSGKSIGRKNMIDTDNSYNDFYIFDTPTFGSINTTSEVLLPTGEFPLLIILILLFILLTYSDRLNGYRINLLDSLNATNKVKSLFHIKKGS
ncbi:lamin tail domain-containing protein [Candidatus Dojkabacteria bacterium]|nr:lamin tail domain-containing protein [Candidatus Dojkabacteria bacterium]